MIDLKEEKVIKTLIESPLSGYYISKRTGITVQTILNYRNNKTEPTKANVQLLEYFFREENNTKNAENTKNHSIIGSNNVQTGDVSNSKIDARQYYSDSPDVLRAQIEEKDRLLEEKECRIKEKDAQIKEKDAQIGKLLGILSK